MKREQGGRCSGRRVDTGSAPQSQGLEDTTRWSSPLWLPGEDQSCWAAQFFSV